MTYHEVAQKQVDLNYAAFEKLLPSLLPAHAGKFALMRDSAIIEFFDTARDAFVAGQKLYEDKVFSVQEVTESLVELGFYSHAITQR